MKLPTPRFEAFSEDSKVVGQAMRAMLESMTVERYEAVLKKHDMDNIQEDKWYSVQEWLDVLKGIYENNPGHIDFVAIGMKTMEMARFPPGYFDMPFPQAMELIDQAYQGNHKGDVGQYKVEVKGPQHLVIDARVPYPDDFVYGNFYALSRMFLAEKMEDFVVEYEPKSDRRDTGGDTTRIHITWEEPKPEA